MTVSCKTISITSTLETLVASRTQQLYGHQARARRKSWPIRQHQDSCQYTLRSNPYHPECWDSRPENLRWCCAFSDGSQLCQMILSNPVTISLDGHKTNLGWRCRLPSMCCFSCKRLWWALASGMTRKRSVSPGFWSVSDILRAHRNSKQQTEANSSLTHIPPFSYHLFLHAWLQSYPMDWGYSYSPQRLRLRYENFGWQADLPR